MVAAAPQNASQAPSGASSSIDDMLARFGLADAVTSGDRSPGRNRAVGGSPTSFHLQPGRARDINPQAAASGRLVSYAYQNPQQFAEFFGPFDWYVKNGQIRRGRFPGHGDHIHAVLT
ncbi:MAG: hypothetical protein HY323_05555 [Betaproteobacteria bacterium]|nr:hypothetical protein [Betaproteobacteria bacterium]